MISRYPIIRIINKCDALNMDYSAIRTSQDTRAIETIDERIQIQLRSAIVQADTFAKQDQ